MNATKIHRVRTHRSTFAKKAMFALALTAVTLPVAFAQSEQPQTVPRKNIKPLPPLEGEALLRAIEHTSKMPAAKIGKPTKGNPSAPAKGTGYAVPFRIDVGNVNTEKWMSIGPFGSRVSANSDSSLGRSGSYVAGRANGVAYDPRNPSIYYVATAGGGVWRHNPADVSSPTKPWRALGDKFPSLATYCVTVSPFNSKVILVGTGAGIQRSINGGNTFVSVGTQLGRVTRILIDPDDANRLYATSTGGGISYSTDLGNSWISVAPATRPSDPRPNSNPEVRRPIGEEWNDIEISESDEDGNRFLYATSRRGGIYRSSGTREVRGATWEPNPLPAPLRFNPFDVQDPPDQYLFFDPLAGNYGIEVAVSATDPFTLYVMDSNGLFSDGRIFVSKDAGNTWAEINGDYPTAEGPSNNWTLSYYSLGMIAVPTDIAGVRVDALLGASRRTYSAEYSAVDSILYSGRDWLSAGATHIDQHGFSYIPNNGNRVLASNDGGIYELTYDTLSRSWNFTGNLLNFNLASTEFYGASFHPSAANTVLGGTINNSVTRAEGNVNDWRQVPFVANAFPPDPGTGINPLVVEMLTLAAPPAAFPGIPNESFFPGMYVGSVAYDPRTPSIQYMMNHANSGGNIYVTRNNWATGWEITPDRIFRFANGVPLRLNGNTISVFNQVNGQDTGTGTNWAGEARRAQGILVVDPFASPVAPPGNILYSGGYYLWRYDLQRGFATVANAANVDRGTWRRVGGTQLAVPETVNDVAEEDYITAIAVAADGQRVYVGTRLGRLWMSRNPRNQDTATPTPQLTGTWIRLDNPTLPSRIDPPPPGRVIRREITAISVNPSSTPSDILVGVRDAGLYRCANTLGTVFQFTPQNGLVGSATSLPNSPISAIVRDTVTRNTNGTSGDADNSWLVGTATGVYATNNQGTTWTDATVPLGLPQVPIVSMDLNANVGTPAYGYLNVATAGRGAWRFNLRGATETVLAPNLAIKYALSRNANTIYGNITVENSGGQAQNVQITGASLITSTQTTTTVPNPANLGAIGTGPSSSRSTTATWAGTAGRRGEVVTLRVEGTYAGGGTFGLNVRTRLP